MVHIRLPLSSAEHHSSAWAPLTGKMRARVRESFDREKVRRGHSIASWPMGAVFDRAFACSQFGRQSSMDSHDVALLHCDTAAQHQAMDELWSELKNPFIRKPRELFIFATLNCWQQ